MFQEYYRRLALWTEDQIVSKLAYRHHHVAFPKRIWDIIWRGGHRDMRKRKGEIFKKWGTQNKNLYRWALELAGIPDIFRVLNRWCGIRKVCRAHKVPDCRGCLREDRSTFSKPVCVQDGRWVVLGIPQGFNAKFAENKPRRE